MKAGTLRKKRPAHPYTLHCRRCDAKTLHWLSHHRGEMLPECERCGNVAPLALIRRGAKAYKVNPAAREVRQAVKLYENFSGEEGDEIARVAAPKVPKVALAIGPVLMIGYETVRDGVREKYVHRFAQHARPLLVASHDGRSVFLLGGAYTFTDRGIVDKKSR